MLIGMHPIEADIIRHVGEINALIGGTLYRAGIGRAEKLPIGKRTAEVNRVGVPCWR